MLVLSCDGLPDLDLEDPDGGLVCSGVDFGWPEAREQVTVNPGSLGEVDNTTKFSGRAGSLDLQVTDGTLGSRAVILGLLTPYFHPARRPVLSYVDDLGGGNVGVRQVTIAPRALNVARAGESVTEAQAQFRIPAGVATDTVDVELTLTPLDTTVAGRTYTRTYPRVYPAATASVPLTVPIWGDAQPWVTARIYGECVGPKFEVTQNGETWTVLAALASVTVPAGDFLAIDMQSGTVLLNGEPGASRYEWVDHAASTWRLPMPGMASLKFTTQTDTPDARLVIVGRGTYFL